MTKFGVSDLAALLHEMFNVPSRGMCGGTHSIGYGECQELAARLHAAGVRVTAPPSDPAAPLDVRADAGMLRRWVESLIAHTEDRDGMVWVTKAEIVAMLRLTATPAPKEADHD